MYKLHAALKLTLKVLVILLVTTFAVPSSNEVKAQDVNVNFDAFYNDLSPYGRWVDHERFGQVWVYNEPGFSPYYTNGRWDYSDYGWTWVSDYAWGWAPFHYGRWENDPAYGGWLWIPGYDWGPGWVEWGEYDDYYGWAPLGSGINININIGMGRARSPWDRWVFLPRGCMADGRRYNDYAIRDRRGLNIYNNITIINKVRTDRNSRYYEGPDRRDVERYSRTNIATRHINALDRPGRTEVRNNNINIYRPNVTSRSGDYNRDGRVDNRDRIGASIDRNNNNNRVERADRSNSPVDRNINTDRSARQNQNAERNIVPQQSQAQDNNAAERSDRNWGNRNITPQQQQQPAPQPQVQANAEQRNSRAGRWGGNSDRNIVPQQQQQPAPQPQVQANAEQRNNSRAGRWGGNERSVAPQQQQQPAPQPQVQANAEQRNNSRAGRWGGNERSVAPQAQPQQQVQPQQRQEVMQQRESRRFEQPQRQQVPAVSPPQNNGKVEKSNDDNRGNGNGWGRRGKN